MSIQFKAILFDFDGVLGRTMDDNYSAWVKALAEYNVVMDAEDYYLQEGRKASEIAEYATRNYGFPPETVMKITDLKDTNYLNDNKFSFYEDVPAVIEWVRSLGLKVGVVSGGSKKRLLDPRVVELLNTFDVVVTASDYSVGKPSPEPYLTAARALNLDPKDCLVVENAPLGIEAAKEAGMKCIAITSTLNKKYLSRADHIIDFLREVTGALEYL